ncbi:glycosyltransferase [Streptomyces sp. NRRL B-24085]|uniref:glycosyltransferase n=1 Tax=Streptomyces sp. NRRL B-24085 TaxID=1709476 RepID=UPI0007C7170B|nr:glycosyltransferase [Streptomyces sp. NRRL B-24085]
MIPMASAVLLGFLLYVLGMFAFGRIEGGREPDDPASDEASRFLFVFVLPCLDEELVIRASLDRLSALPDRQWMALVVDDDSHDRTAEIVERHPDPRVMLLRRHAPLARQGKGEALNTAYRHIGGELARAWRIHGYTRDRIILVVLDADGRVAPDVLSTVAPLFRDARVGGVQIAVRIHNAASGLLARLQDMEFVVFTEIFQRARSRIGSAGLGGNGQFTRLSALDDLGESPWSRCLTEDLDLGVRMVCQGWRTRFTARTCVSQQALTRLRPFLRQRTRWFQGHLQCGREIPGILRAQLTAATAANLLITLTLPLLILLTTFSVVAFYAIAFSALRDDGAANVLAPLTANNGTVLILWCLVSFGVAPVCAYVYMRADTRTGLLKGVTYAFLYSFYCYHWLPVGWLAVWRQLSRRRTWSKSRRLPEHPS